MGLGRHLKQHWVGWFTTAIGIGLAFYFYRESIEARDPVFIVDPNRAEIISHARIETAPIRVVRHDGRAVTGDLYAVRFYLWNAGKRSIRPENVLDTIRIIMDEPAEILDFKILKQSRAISGSQLHGRPGSAGLRELVVTVSILEQNDGFTGQIIYQGPHDVPIRIASIIEGAALGIRDGSELAWLDVIRRTDYGWLLFFGSVLLIGVMLIVLFAVIRDIVRWSPPPSEAAAESKLTQEQLAQFEQWERRRRRGPQTRGDLLFVAITVAVILTLAVKGIADKYSGARATAAVRSVSAVPRAMLP